MRNTGNPARPTRYPELGYAQVTRGVWQHIDMKTGAQVGPQYASKAELLADTGRYARVFGCADAPEGNPAGSEPAHTPTDWRVDVIPGAKPRHWIAGRFSNTPQTARYAFLELDFSGFGLPVSELDPAATAALIVRAVNAHDALVSALRDLLHGIACAKRGMPLDMLSTDSAEAVLKLTEGN